MTTVFYALIFAVAAFLAGSVPFGFLIGKCRGVDIRKLGSCNIGATNVTRVVGKWWGKLCFLLDFGKGFLPVFAAELCRERGLFSDGYGLVPALTAFAVVAGHIWPVYLKFKGGKGVATAAGALMVLCWPAVLTALICWTGVFLVSRYVSLASISAAVVLPVTAIALKCAGVEPELSPASILLMLLLGALTIYKHRANIRRLREGTENRFVKGDSAK